MKWSKESKNQLTELAYQEKSNKEIAEAMNIDIKDVYAARSRFNITIPKVKAAKESESVKTEDYRVAYIESLNNVLFNCEMDSKDKGNLNQLIGHLYSEIESAGKMTKELAVELDCENLWESDNG